MTLDFFGSIVGLHTVAGSWFVVLAAVSAVILGAMFLRIFFPIKPALPVSHTATDNDVVTVHRWYPLVGLAVVLCLIAIGYYHYGQLDIPLWRIPVVVMSFIWMCIIIVAAHLHQTRSGDTPSLEVAVVIPNHNEDPVMLRAMLDSMDAQTVPPRFLYLIENGATNGDARKVFTAWKRKTKIPEAIFMYREEPGKREAQAAVFAMNTTAEIFLTVDGDTRLDPRAIENGLKPFSDARIMSVAGLLVAQNRDENLLTRVLDIGFVSSFMNGRAAWSLFRSVAVNCGGLAFYRASIVRLHLEEYTSQTMFGQRVNSGDDRMLTGFAALEGDTVFQESSVGYTLLPNNISHLTRQRARWWRSFWWGGVWLLRRFSMTRAIWWLVISQYITFSLYAVLFPFILVVDPIKNQQFPWLFLGYVVAISYLRSARTLAVRRPDQTISSQLANYLLLSPFVSMLNLWLCTILQWWGLFTFYITGWGTRKKVEVSIEETAI